MTTELLHPLPGPLLTQGLFPFLMTPETSHLGLAED